MDSRSNLNHEPPKKKQRQALGCVGDNATASPLRDIATEKVKEKCFQLVPASPSLFELSEVSGSFHSPAEKQQQKPRNTLSTLSPGTVEKSAPPTSHTPTLTPPTISTPSTVEKDVTPPTFSTPPTLQPLLKFRAKAVGGPSLPPPRRLKSATVKRTLDFGNAARKLDEEWLARITKFGQSERRDMNCPAYKKPSLTLSSMLGSSTTILPDHPNDTITTSERPPSVHYLSILHCLPREQ